ncbi:MAG: anti-sigma factor RsiW [Planctomycetota bacterium]|jgi:anti-sigma factor RsiW
MNGEGFSMKNPEDDKLWAYLDGALRAREHSIMKKRLCEEPALQGRLDQLLQIHELLGATLSAIDTVQSTERVVNQVTRQLHEKPDTDTTS